MIIGGPSSKYNKLYNQIDDIVKDSGSSGIACIPLNILKEFQTAIMELSAVEEEVSHRERSLEQIASVNPAALYIFDMLQRRGVFFNKKITDLLGYTQPDLDSIPGRFEALMHPEDIARMPAHFEHLAAAPDGGVIPVEYRMRHADGSWRWFYANDVVFRRDDSGQVTQILGSALDVTELKRVEDELEESEERFRAIVAATSGHVWRYLPGQQSPDTLTTLLWEHLTGQPACEMVGLRFLELVHPEDRSSVFEAFVPAIIGGQDLACEVEFRVHGQSDDSWIWLQVKGVPLLNPDGSVREWVGTLTDITERKIAETKLQESEERYRTLFESASDGIVVHEIITKDYRGKILEANGVICDMLGYSIEELRRCSPLDIQEEVNQEGMPEALEKMLSDSSLLFERTLITKDGRKIPVEINSKILNHHGKTTVLSIVRNITERKIAEKALKESEERLRLALDAGRMGSWEVDGSTGTGHIDEVDARLLGLPADTSKITAEEFFSCIHPDDRQAISQFFEAARRNGSGNYDSEYRVILPDGTMRWIASKGCVIPGRDGMPLRVVGVNYDISGRKRMEEEIYHSKRELALRVLEKTAELQEANKALCESRDYLDKIINSIGDPIFVKDRLHRLVLVNDAACRLFGRSREDLIGNTAYDLFPARETADISWQKDEEIFLSGSEEVNEEINTDASGLTRTTLVKKTPCLDDAGDEFFVGIMRDITELVPKL